MLKREVSGAWYVTINRLVMIIVATVSLLSYMIYQEFLESAPRSAVVKTRSCPDGSVLSTIDAGGYPTCVATQSTTFSGDVVIHGKLRVQTPDGRSVALIADPTMERIITTGNATIGDTDHGDTDHGDITVTSAGQVFAISR